MSADLMLGSPGADYAGAALTLADAVIAELGLQKQSQTGEIVNIIEGDNINYSRHRHVTEWETTR